MEATTFTEQFKLSEKEERIFRVLKRARELTLEAKFRESLVLRVNGGWVRDKLLGKGSIDIDISLDTLTGVDFTQFVLAAYKDTFPDTHNLNKNSDVRPPAPKTEHLQTATIQIEELLIDLVNLRVEDYSDGRAPTSNVFGTAEQDAFRRDLTINALFYNINEAKVEDFTGIGLQDLKNGIIRTPKPAKTIFLEDPLRIARTLKFASRLNYQIDPSIFEAISDPVVYEAMKSKVSKEKIHKEVVAALQDSNCTCFLNLAFQTNFIHQLLDMAEEKTSDPVSKDFISAQLNNNKHG